MTEVVCVFWMGEMMQVCGKEMEAFRFSFD